MDRIIKECKKEYDGKSYNKLKHLLYLLNKENKYDEYKNEVYNIEKIECVNQKTFYKILLNNEKMSEEMIKLLCDLNLFAEENQYQVEYDEKIKKMEEDYKKFVEKEINRHKEVMKDKEIILREKDIELKKVELEILRLNNL